VRSTLRAVPATVPDPFSNTVREITGAWETRRQGDLENGRQGDHVAGLVGFLLLNFVLVSQSPNLLVFKSLDSPSFTPRRPGRSIRFPIRFRFGHPCSASIRLLSKVFS